MEGMCDLTNNIKPPLLSVISSIYYHQFDYTDVQTDYVMNVVNVLK